MNNDAASRQTDLLKATSNYCAQLRWKSSRAAFIGLVQEMAGLTAKDITTELQLSRVRRYRHDLKKVMEYIMKSQNPFQSEDKAKKNM